MIECGAEAITIGETTSMWAAREIADRVKPSYPIGGKVSAYKVIHNCPVERIMDHVRVAVEEGADMVAPGCDFWLGTPTEHVRAFVEARAFGKQPNGR